MLSAASAPSQEAEILTWKDEGSWFPPHTCTVSASHVVKLPLITAVVREQFQVQDSKASKQKDYSITKNHFLVSVWPHPLIWPCLSYQRYRSHSQDLTTPTPSDCVHQTWPHPLAPPMHTHLLDWCSNWASELSTHSCHALTSFFCAAPGWGSSYLRNHKSTSHLGKG